MLAWTVVVSQLCQRDILLRPLNSVAYTLWEKILRLYFKLANTKFSKSKFCFHLDFFYYQLTEVSIRGLSIILTNLLMIVFIIKIRKLKFANI